MLRRVLVPVVAVAAVASSAIALPPVVLAAGPGPGRTVGPTAVAVEVPAASAIRLDGDLSEEAWKRAEPITEFVQRDPKEGAEPTMKTEARVLYDATNLYVAVRAYDPEPDRIVAHLTRRDVESPSDWIRVTIDSFHDRRTAYEFGVNPVGVKQDKYWFNDGNTNDTSWDAIWDVTVQRDTEGWRAEFRIPFSQLRFSPNADGTFGLALVRQVARLNESSTWPLLSKNITGYVSQFGELSGIRLARAPKRLELQPYTVGMLTTQPDGGSPLLNSTDPSAALGLDLKYALTPGLTLTATVNPDFGQVEADPAVVNLSAFETFFSERRPFFVEGSGNFRFDVDCSDGLCTGLFYTRRIGRAPQATDDLPSGDDTYSLVPAQTTILGAAKVTGRKGPYSIGLLHAVTQEEKAAIAMGAARGAQVVEPMTNYSVARIRREFKNQSYVGFMTTATERKLTESTSFLPAQAYTGGVDMDWRFGRRYSLTAYWAGSHLRGNAGAIANVQQTSRHYFQRPDSDALELDPTRTSLSGQSASVGIGKISGEYMVFNSNVGHKSPGYDTNDLGFFRRADQKTVGNWIQFRSTRPNKWFRSRRVNFNQYAGWNADGDLLYSGGNINSHYTLVNMWSFGGGFNVNHDEFDDRLTRGGPGGWVEGYKSFWTYVNSDERKVMTFNGFFGRGWTKNGSWFSDINPSITIRPKSSLSLTGGVSINRNVLTQQWIENVEADATHYVFGGLDQTTVSVTTRVNYTLSPTLSIQLYAQPFVSAGDYSKFQELENGRAKGFAARWAPYDYLDNPDFNYRSFRTTNVLRWEYRPGSTLFIVWQQGREDSVTRGDFRFGRDFGDVFGAPATNVFLVKLAYWLNY